MALTTHWEWRAFGKVSRGLQDSFEGVVPQQLVDEYLWTPNIELNIKFRTGARQDGLKIKRFHERSGDFEKWIESRSEIFPLPLTAAAEALIPNGAQRVRVVKERRSRLWNGVVKVELAKIFTPVEAMSVGLEMVDGIGQPGDAESIALLAAAILDLNLASEELAAMNYLRWLDSILPHQNGPEFAARHD